MYPVYRNSFIDVGYDGANDVAIDGFEVVVQNQNRTVDRRKFMSMGRRAQYIDIKLMANIMTVYLLAGTFYPSSINEL